jgi:hypothetical protein
MQDDVVFITNLYSTYTIISPLGLFNWLPNVAFRCRRLTHGHSQLS